MRILIFICDENKIRKNDLSRFTVLYRPAFFYADKGTGNGEAMNRSRFKLDQNHAPIHEALEKFLRMRVVPFDVPGHKRGRGNPELAQ